MRQKGVRSVHTYPSYLKVCDLYTGQYIHYWYSGMLLFANGPVCWCSTWRSLQRLRPWTRSG
jgi:hypothetical protein